jgi:uncharacterized protein YjbI with pentapeptide repeats
MRKSLEETWLYLESEHAAVPRHPDGRPLVPDQMPSFDDKEPLGFSYFRSGLEDADRSHLTIPRTFFGRSWLVRVNFADTDLSESRMCWNDFDECDFSGADLSGCDMRASIFRRCRFDRAVLRGADLRCSSFEGCTFVGAEMAGAVVDQAGTLGDLIDELSEAQFATLSFTQMPGPEPPGG